MESFFNLFLFGRFKGSCWDTRTGVVVGDQLTGKRVEQYAEEEQKKEGRNL